MAKKHKSLNDVSPAIRSQIKKEYMEYKPISQIARKYDIPRQSLQYYVSTKWREERALMRSQLFANFSEGKRVAFTDMSESAIEIMKRALKDLANRPEPPDIKEASKVADILASLDKIQRLDDNQPTDIMAEKPMDIVSIRQKLSLDPFSEENEEDDSSKDNKDFIEVRAVRKS